MTAPRVRDVVAKRPIETVVRRRVGGGAAERGDAGDRDHADLILSWHECEIRRRRDVGKLLETKAAVREARRVEQRRRDDPLVLDGEKLVPRHRVSAVGLETG